MEETRASLAEKIEALGSQVSDTVQTTTEAVSSTVETVKDVVESVTDKVTDTVQSVTDTVQDTVQTVADTFNFPKLVETRPWLVFGGSVALGVVGGYLLGGRSSSSRAGQHPSTSGSGSWFGGSSDQDMTSRMASSSQSAPSGHDSSWGQSQGNGSWGQSSAAQSPTATSSYSGSTGGGSQVDRSNFGGSGWLWDQLGRLKNLGLAALMGVVRDLSTRSLPEVIGHKLAEEVDHMTTSLGAEPIRGKILEDQPQGSQSQNPQGNQGSSQTGHNGGHSSTSHSPASSGGM